MQTQEKKLFSISGALMLAIWLVWALATAFGFFSNIQNMSVAVFIVCFISGILLLIMLGGFYIVPPNTAVVATFFGRYIGTQLQNGWFWSNPWAIRKSISLKLRNFNSEKLKVNDQQGNPIEIAAVVVWRVVNSAKAIFDVENYQQFVSFQAETALRHLANTYPYDDHEGNGLSLRGNADEIAGQLKLELDNRLTLAGVEVVDARLSHLAYAPEIAQAMLQRQQASAILAARQKIVEGAVSMVQMALQKLADENIVELDEERKAQMVSNLLVVLTSEKNTQPVINTGSLY